MSLSRTAAVATAAVVVSLSGSPMAAHAAKPDREPCAKEQQQVDKAQEALDRLTALSDRKQTKTEKKKKKAQQQRLAEAQARLDACLAGQVEEPEPTT